MLISILAFGVLVSFMLLLSLDSVLLCILIFLPLSLPQFQNCQLEETHFPSIETPKPNQTFEFSASETSTMTFDPRTALANAEVSKLLHLKSLAEKLPNGFSNTVRITCNPLSSVGSSPITILPRSHLLPKCSKLIIFVFITIFRLSLTLIM